MLFRKKREVAALTSNSNSVVEFLGVSGVGKTYLYNSVVSGVDSFPCTLKQCKLDKDYDTLHHKLARSSGKKTKKIKKHLGLDKAMYSSGDYLFLIQEGIFQYYSHQMLLFLENSDQYIEFILKNRKFVFCYAPKNIVVDRILQRFEESGKLLSSHDYKNISQLYDAVDHRISIVNRLFLKLQLYSDHLYVDTSQDLSGNVVKVVDFLSFCRS